MQNNDLIHDKNVTTVTCPLPGKTHWIVCFYVVFFLVSQFGASSLKDKMKRSFGDLEETCFSHEQEQKASHSLVTSDSTQFSLFL